MSARSRTPNKGLERGFSLSVGFAIVLLIATPAASDPSAGVSAEAAEEEDVMPPPGYLPGHRQRLGLGLSPHVPLQQSILPGGVTPAFGAPLRVDESAKFDFNGYIQAGARASFGERKNPTNDQSELTLHGDPVVPRGNVFENTNTVPYTWGEVRFAYSTRGVSANVSIGAWSFSEAMQSAGSFMPNAQYWIRNAFLSYEPKGLDPVKLKLNVGVYEDTYGAMAEYSTGQYGAPLIATIAGVGETLMAQVPLGHDLRLDIEQGIKSSLDRPPVDVPTGPANNWPKPWEGQTLVNHAHVGLNYQDTLSPTLHWISAISMDDTGDSVPLGGLRAGYRDYEYGSGPVQENRALDHADGSLRILAADVRLALKRFGHLYVGVSHAKAEHIRTVTGVVQILNAGGGRDLMDRYFGRNNDRGRGSLLLAGGEYTISLGELLRYPGEFWGEGPDLRLSVFGMYAHVTSDDPARDGEDKYKFGAEAAYSVLPWLVAAGRVDRSVPYAKRLTEPLYPGQNDNSYSVLTLKTVFRSDWTARETLTLQYSNYFYRSRFHLVSLNAGGQISTQSDEPDQHLLALYGTLWW